MWRLFRNHWECCNVPAWLRVWWLFWHDWECWGFFGHDWERCNWVLWHDSEYGDCFDVSESVVMFLHDWRFWRDCPRRCGACYNIITCEPWWLLWCKCRCGCAGLDDIHTNLKAGDDLNVHWHLAQPHLVSLFPNLSSCFASASLLMVLFSSFLSSFFTLALLSVALFFF